MWPVIKSSALIVENLFWKNPLQDLISSVSKCCNFNQWEDWIYNRSHDLQPGLYLNLTDDSHHGLMPNLIKKSLTVSNKRCLFCHLYAQKCISPLPWILKPPYFIHCKIVACVEAPSPTQCLLVKSWKKNCQMLKVS